MLNTAESSEGGWQLLSKLWFPISVEIQEHTHTYITFQTHTHTFGCGHVSVPVEMDELWMSPPVCETVVLRKQIKDIKSVTLAGVCPWWNHELSMLVMQTGRIVWHSPVAASLCDFSFWKERYGLSHLIFSLSLQARVQGRNEREKSFFSLSLPNQGQSKQSAEL